MLHKFIVAHLNYNDRIHFHSSHTLRLITAGMAILCFFSVLYYLTHSMGTPLDAKVFLFIFALLAVVFLFLEKLSFTGFFLLSTFTTLASWRLSALAGYTIAQYLYLITTILILLNFFIAAAQDCWKKNHCFPGKHNSPYEWQLLFIRMYLGYDLVPHFCEKLFAGTAIRMDDVNAFINLGVPHAYTMVLIAGAIEFFGGLALSCGIFTRLASVCLFVYLLVSTQLGHHFSNSFIWASPGGGWEYPVLWSVLIVSFVFFGAGTFSIDEILKERLALPRYIRALM